MNNYTAIWHYPDGSLIDEITTKSFKMTFKHMVRWVKICARSGAMVNNFFTSKVTFTRNGKPLPYELIVCHPTAKIKATDIFMKVKGHPHYLTTVYMKAFI